MRDKFDVVIVGGAVVGSAAAYFLARAGGASVLVLERDPAYVNCATTRSLASIRHQFSTPENIRLSMFGTAFIRSALQELDSDVSFREGGYLFLSTTEGWPVLQENHATQRAEGADVALLQPAELQARFPWLAVDDLAAGSLGLSGEGWLDGHALMHGFRRKAIALGAEYRKAEGVAFECDGGRVSAVQLADGSRIACGFAINSAGTSAAALARSAGVALPVESRKRCVFHFRSPAQLGPCPLVIDPTGLYFRPEGEGFLCGIAPPQAEDPECQDFEVPLEWWEERLWPALAQRVPGFEAARLVSAWAGHYDVNTLDANVVLGPHPKLPNLLFANGFSGHGLQHSPGIGRALAELVLHGGFRTLDLSRLGWARVLANQPLRERNVV